MDHRIPVSQKTLTELRRRTPELLQEAREQRVAYMVTDRGQVAGMIVDPESWEMLNRRLDLLEQLALGMQDVAEGRLTDHGTVKGEFRKWL
jgi:PHD/YefM family antitoxin component YafN of YafNO toxin-antitoxin module